MTNDTLRTILPIAGWGEERTRGPVRLIPSIGAYTK